MSDQDTRCDSMGPGDICRCFKCAGCRAWLARDKAIMNAEPIAEALDEGVHPPRPAATEAAKNCDRPTQQEINIAAKSWIGQFCGCQNKGQDYKDGLQAAFEAGVKYAFVKTLDGKINPIKTVPRDGTMFEAWVPDAHGGRWWKDLAFDARGDLRKGSDQSMLPRWPTHWRMPCP